MKSSWILTITIAAILSACSDEKTSQEAAELKALWVVDADRQSQEVHVIGRVVETGDTVQEPSLSFAIPVNNGPQPASENDDLFNEIFDNSRFIRLTGKDAMRVFTPTGMHQLYRRSKPLEYQTLFAFDENSIDYELRLDYDGIRYPAALTNARVFDVSDLNIAEADSVIASGGNINISWSIGDVMPTTTQQFSQTLQVELLECTGDGIAPVSTEISIPDSSQSITLTSAQLPKPMNLSELAQTATTLAGECSYGIQLLARLVSIAEDTNVVGNVTPTPEVLLISRSRQQRVTVSQGLQVQP